MTWQKKKKIKLGCSVCNWILKNGLGINYRTRHHKTNTWTNFAIKKYLLDPRWFFCGFYSLFLRWCSPNVSTTPFEWGFRQCLPFSWTKLRGRHCRHPIAVMGIVDTFGRRLLYYLYQSMIIFLPVCTNFDLTNNSDCLSSFSPSCTGRHGLHH